MSSPRAGHVHVTSEPRPQASTAERAATFLSLACAVHCLVVPIAMSVMPLLGASGVTDLAPEAELALTLMVAASAIAGVTWGYRRHRDARIVLATGVVLAAYLVGHLHEAAWYGIGLAVAGALVVAASSFLGARLSHACSEPGCATEAPSTSA